MADTLPVDTTSPGIAALPPPIARLDVPLAQLDADLQMLRLKREAADRMRRLMVADLQYDVDHLDPKSKYALPGSYPVDYLHLGGQS